MVDDVFTYEEYDNVELSVPIANLDDDIIVNPYHEIEYYPENHMEWDTIKFYIIKQDGEQFCIVIGEYEAKKLCNTLNNLRKTILAVEKENNKQSVLLENAQKFHNTTIQWLYKKLCELEKTHQQMRFHEIDSSLPELKFTIDTLEELKSELDKIWE